MIFSPYCRKTAETHDKLLWHRRSVCMSRLISDTHVYAHTWEDSLLVYLWTRCNCTVTHIWWLSWLHVQMCQCPITDWQPRQTLCNVWGLCNILPDQNIEQMHVSADSSNLTNKVEVLLVRLTNGDCRGWTHIGSSTLYLLCFTDSGGKRRQIRALCRKSALRHSRDRRKRERGERGRGGQGHSEGREGCVFTDLDTAIEPPPLTSHPPTLPHYWRVKGTFKQYQTDRKESQASGETDRGQKNQQTGRRESRKM